jgi:hypothetical protein
MCNQCEENERKLLVDRPTDIPTDSSKAICLPSSKGGIKSISKQVMKYMA